MAEDTGTGAGNKPRLVGINHIALEVGDIDEALAFYGKIFDFTLRAKRPGNAAAQLLAEMLHRHGQRLQGDPATIPHSRSHCRSPVTLREGGRSASRRGRTIADVVRRS